MERYYLMPCERQNQKSFGCMAVVEVRDDGTNVLYSYTTKIAKITTSGSFVRLCDHEANCSSPTTMRHIVAFRVSNGLPSITKKEWDSMPTLRD